MRHYDRNGNNMQTKSCFMYQSIVLSSSYCILTTLIQWQMFDIDVDYDTENIESDCMVTKIWMYEFIGDCILDCQSTNDEIFFQYHSIWE